MSNRLFQSIIIQLGEAASRVVGVIDENAAIVACSELAVIGESRPGIMEFYDGRSETFCANGYTYCFTGYNRKDEYAVFVEGVDEEAAKMAKIAVVTLSGIRQYHDEQYDVGNFIKNVVTENILPGDIYTKAREIKFTTDMHRVALLVRLSSASAVTVFDIIAGFFPDDQKDFVFSVSENDIVIIKEVPQGESIGDIERLAGSIIDVLAEEHNVSSIIGIGTIIGRINELASSLREAQVALEVGKVFDTEHPIITYDNLGIARLIYQLPTTLCEMFLREVFRKGSIDSLDAETLFTIQRFFENNLNVSETSRGLFVHRNTLVYRLEKIKKLTGLDLRQFDHAIIFKVALMVKKYLDAKPVKY